MSKKSVLLLVVWNVLLSAGLAWSLTRAGGNRGLSDHDALLTGELEGVDTLLAPTTMRIDTAALKEARIAFFFMDSIQSGYELVKESASRVRKEGQRLEGDLAREMQKAQTRAQELAAKDHTYSTQAELEADEKEFRALEERIGEMRANSQDRMDEMQIKMLQDITLEIQDFLTEYNKTAGFDYIFSIQESGQIWVGNKGLDISADVVGGLNARHRAKKVAK